MTVNRLAVALTALMMLVGLSIPALAGARAAPAGASPNGTGSKNVTRAAPRRPAAS